MNKIVYVPMIADLVHAGHIKVLERDASLGEVVVGLFSNSAVAEMGDKAFLSFDQRKEVLERITFVSRVVEQKTASYKYMIQKINPHYVVHGDDWKVGSVTLAGPGLDRQWSRRATAAAKIVRADDEKAVRIERLAWTNAVVPPAGFAIVRVMVAGGVMVSGQRVTDQNGIVARAVERTVGLEAHVIAIERDPAVQGQRGREMLCLRRDQADAIFWK